MYEYREQEQVEWYFCKTQNRINKVAKGEWRWGVVKKNGNNVIQESMKITGRKAEGNTQQHLAITRIIRAVQEGYGMRNVKVQE